MIVCIFILGNQKQPFADKIKTRNVLFVSYISCFSHFLASYLPYQKMLTEKMLKICLKKSKTIFWRILSQLSNISLFFLFYLQATIFPYMHIRLYIFIYLFESKIIIKMCNNKIYKKMRMKKTLYFLFMKFFSLYRFFLLFVRKITMAVLKRNICRRSKCNRCSLFLRQNILSIYLFVGVTYEII